MRKGKKVWLVTWEWGVADFDKYTDTDRVAAIINSRYSGKSVRQLVELLYVTKFYSLNEKMDWAQGRQSPLSHFGSINSAPWDGQISCGHGPPSLYARLVDDFCIERDESGKDKATWTENATHSAQSTLLRMG